MSWFAVDGGGRELATGRPPRGPGASSPIEALLAAPVASWPVTVVADDGRRLTLGQALGPGGGQVEHLLARIVFLEEVPGLDVEALATSTPAGDVELPVALVSLAEGVHAAREVDPLWLSEVERVRAAPRRVLVQAGRETELEAALHVAMLLATECLRPAAEADSHWRVASGAQLWLLGGAVAWALSGGRPDPFAAWGRLLTAGLWPVGPSRGQLVVSTVPPAR